MVRSPMMQAVIFGLLIHFFRGKLALTQQVCHCTDDAELANVAHVGERECLWVTPESGTLFLKSGTLIILISQLKSCANNTQRSVTDSQNIRFGALFIYLQEVDYIL